MPFASPRHFFTVNVEDYFHERALEPYVARASWAGRPSRIERNVDLLLGLLAKHEARATFFTLGWIAEHHPGVVRAIARAGHEIASHGATHRRLDELSPEQFRDEVRSSKLLLEDLTGTQVVGFRAPNFSIVPGSEWAFDVLLEESYEYDSSRLPIDRPSYGSPISPRYPHAVRCESVGASLVEIPLTTLDVMGSRMPAGGASLRHLPYAAVRGAFRAAERAGVPGVFYVHPWEMDPEQPRIPMSLATRMRHYGGLARTAPRLGRLLEEFQFGSIASALPHLVQNAPAIAA